MSANSASRPVRVTFPENIKHEIQVLVAVNCRELVFQGRDCKEEAQFEKMKKLFHGTESHASLLKQFMNGKAPFDCCFDKEILQNNREGNEDRNQFMLKLKEIFHCMTSYQFYVHERGFTTDAIASTRGNPLTGRNLNDKFRVASANYKHALRFYNEYCPGGRYPSGKTFEDMLLYVRQKMFVHLQGAKDQQGANRLCKRMAEAYRDLVEKAQRDGTPSPEKPTPMTDEDMPEEYFFTGYFAFIVFGPVGLSKVSLSCFTVDGKGVKKVGRKEQRQKDAKEKTADREKGFYPDDYNRRGVSLTNTAAAAQLAQREALERRRSINDQLYSENQNHANCIEELKQVNDMLEKARNRSAPEREIDYLESWQGSIFDQLSDNRKRKKDLQEESDRLRKEKDAKVLNDYYKLVGKSSPMKKLTFETPNNNDKDKDEP